VKGSRSQVSEGNGKTIDLCQVSLRFPGLASAGKGQFKMEWAEVDQGGGAKKAPSALR